MGYESICQRCITIEGGCCTDVKLLIHKSESKNFLNKNIQGSIPNGHFITEDIMHPDHNFYDSNGERCMFLGDNDLCTIYQSRPLICRMYPLKWLRDYDFHIHLSCPLSYIIPLKDILKWADDNDKEKELIQLMGPMDFNSSSNSYVNVTQLKGQFNQLNLIK